MATATVASAQLRPGLGLTSAEGILALLGEQENELKTFALQRLNELVDQFWAEIAEQLPRIEELHSDAHFPHAQLAALVAAKVYYHLGSLEDAVEFALRAGSLFDLTEHSEFVHTIITKCIDQYTQLRATQYDQGNENPDVPAALQDVVNRMFQRCFADRTFEQAVGVALEARRLDVLRTCVEQAPDRAALLSYCFRAANDFVAHRGFRREVLRLLVSEYSTLEQPDYIQIVQCHLFNEDPAAVAHLLRSLQDAGGDAALVALQLSFQLAEMASQRFLQAVLAALTDDSAAGPADDSGANPAAAGAAAATAAAAADPAPLTGAAQLRSILSGDVSMQLYMEFLFKNNRTDKQILRNMKTWVDPRYSMLHSGVVFANALMHLGTTSDVFLRQNMDWMGRAANWARFTATASLGLIHKGNVKNAMAVLGSFLPGSAAGGSPYSEGGSLFALGLLHATHGAPVVPKLMQYLRNAIEPGQAQGAAAVATASHGGTPQVNGPEIVQHGACLGLGFAAIATGSSEIVDVLIQDVLHSQSAVAGEAAGYALGLVLLGSGNMDVVEQMVQMAHDTQHEKIIRGLAVGTALVMLGTEEGADALIDRLCADEDPLLRYGCMHVVAMAYCGTSSNKVIRRLLHVAVSDVSDDVRRAAVTALGFVLLREPAQVPRMVALLAESYNPHVRCGAAMALGLACANTGMAEAVDLLERLATDSVDFVRQGAFLGLAMVLLQCSDALNPKADKIRKMFEKVVQEKHEDMLAKFGALLATGLIDAGGRNVALGLMVSGHLNMAAVAGMLLFQQSWYWFPMVYSIGLSLVPTAVIGLNADLKMPKFSFKSNARPALFAYPPPVQLPVKEGRKRVTTAVLSTTAKAAKRRAEKERLKSGVAPMTGVERTGDAAAADAAAAGAAGDEAAGTAPAAEKKKEEVKRSEVLENPARVTAQQQRYLSFDVDERYRPVIPGVRSGILLLRDTRPGEPQELVNVSVPTAPAEEAEPAPPEPFEFTE